MDRLNSNSRCKKSKDQEKISPDQEKFNDIISFVVPAATQELH